MKTVANNLSIYIHWPFCLSKCPYCDFNSHVASSVDHDYWLKSYKKEIEYFKYIIQNKYIKSIFFGGGTPSLMDPKTVEGIINKISSLAIIDEQTEITLETNPTSFEAEKFKAFKVAGVNRVSIGVQSLKEDDLKKLGRTHDVLGAIKTIETANKIFSRVSFDLIYARENQTLNDWQQELKQAMELATGHISLYQLTIEKGTPFYKLFYDGNLILPNSDLAAEMYEWTNDYLESQKYSRYEISNYAKRGQECVHNLTYWHYNSYLGIGPGAHSRIYSNDLKNCLCKTSGNSHAHLLNIGCACSPLVLHSNSPNHLSISEDPSAVSAIMMWHKPEKWLEAVNSKGNGVQTYSKLTKQEIVEEILMMGLRLSEGIDIKILEQKIEAKLEDILDMNNLRHYRKLDLIRLDENIYLTDKRLMLHSYIVPRLLN